MKHATHMKTTKLVALLAKHADDLKITGTKDEMAHTITTLDNIMFGFRKNNYLKTGFDHNCFIQHNQEQV